MTQTSIFDLMEAQKLRDMGMKLAATANYHAEDWVRRAREFALYYAAKNGEVTMDDVHRHVPKPDEVPHNAAGSVFKDKRFKAIGFQKSQKVSSHARRITVWGLV